MKLVRLWRPNQLTINVKIVSRGLKDTLLGRVEQIKIYSPKYENLSWEEIEEVFNINYPGKWAIQIFPPQEFIVNGKSVYHLFVLNEEPFGMNIK